MGGEEQLHLNPALALAVALTLALTLTRWAEKSSFIDTVVEKDASNHLLPRYHMHMVLNDAYKAFAFSAAKRVISHNTHFAISLDSSDADNSSSAFCGKLPYRGDVGEMQGRCREI